MKKEDVVICIDTSGGVSLTVEKQYKVLEASDGNFENEPCIQILNDYNQVAVYHAYRFKPVQQKQYQIW